MLAPDFSVSFEQDVLENLQNAGPEEIEFVRVTIRMLREGKNVQWSDPGGAVVLEFKPDIIKNLWEYWPCVDDETIQ